MTITADKLTAVCPSLKGAKSVLYAGIFTTVCPSYGINQPTIFHEFVANVLEESWELSKFEENLNYRAERIIQVWPGRFPTLLSAIPYAHNPQKLANKVYGGRMGNTQPNDGWDLRGGGPMQITGRDMYTQFTLFYNKKFGANYTIYQIAVLLRTDPVMGIHSACWVFAISKKLIPLALADNLKAIVYRINGGYTNMAERTDYYNRAKKIIV